MIKKKYLTFSRFELKLIRFILISKPNILGTNQDNSITIYQRSLFIRPEYLDFSFMVFDGKEYMPITITSFQIGDRFGDYSFPPIQVLINHDKKKKIKKKVKTSKKDKKFDTEGWDI